MSLLAIVVALVVILAAGAVLASTLRRRRPVAAMPDYPRVRPESLLADPDDAQGRAEASARDRRRASAPS